MQYCIYRNNGNHQIYPYLIDIQSDIIGELNTRLMIPLFPLKNLSSPPATRLNPVIAVEGDDFLVMVHEMASVRLSQCGEAVMNARPYRQLIRDALDFLLDGF